MDISTALAAMQDAIVMAAKLSAPLLLLSMLVGLVIAVFQAATQIHEQTLTFVPKLIILALVLIISGSWMLENLVDFMNQIFELMRQRG